MKTFLQHILTGIDNQTWDIGRVGFALAVIAYTIAMLWMAIQYKQFNAVDIGGGYGAIAGGFGALLKLKEKSEPQS